MRGLAFVFCVWAATGAAAKEPSAVVADAGDGAYEEIVVRGEDPKNGIFDPSIEYDGHGVLWLAYSVVEVPKYVHIHLAKSADEGKTWDYVATVNRSTDDTIRAPNGEKIEGAWRHEVATLVRDPSDTARPWKLFWHKYFTRPPYKDRMLQYGWIAYREAADPAGPWSEETPLFGAGLFPRAPYNTSVDLARLHPDLKDCKVLTEPGSLANDGAIYVGLQTYHRSLFGPKSDWRIVLLSSSDHGKTWQYVATLLLAAQAKTYGGDFFTGTSLAEDQGSAFLLVCPEKEGNFAIGHRGTVVFEFDDLAKGKLKNDERGDPLPVKRLPPQLAGGGQSDYDQHDSYGGIIMPQFDRANLPRPWRIYNTRTPILNVPPGGRPR